MVFALTGRGMEVCFRSLPCALLREFKRICLLRCKNTELESFQTTRFTGNFEEIFPKLRFITFL